VHEKGALTAEKAENASLVDTTEHRGRKTSWSKARAM